MAPRSAPGLTFRPENLTPRRKEKADSTAGHKAASPRPNTKKSFAQQGHEGRKEIPLPRIQNRLFCIYRFVSATFAALL
jgi:hypothetical protein